jgi:DNA-binding winged helix-turn-helix (wHTH) protein
MSLDRSVVGQNSDEVVQRTATSVQIIRWPSESGRREQCQTRRIPRLLLLEGPTSAPVCVDELEDWVRAPVSREELKARTTTLHARAVTKIAPLVDSDEVLRYRGRWLALSPVEARLMQALVKCYRNVVSREVLLAHGWPQSENGRQPRRNALDLHILRLRRRLSSLRLAIRTVWGRGYLLEPDSTPLSLESYNLPAAGEPWMTGNSNGNGNGNGR